MKKILAVALLALSFTTGFTCSKQTPDAPPPVAPPQDQMGAPAGEPPAGEVPPPMPTEGGAAPAAPATPPPAEPGH